MRKQQNLSWKLTVDARVLKCSEKGRRGRKDQRVLLFYSERDREKVLPGRGHWVIRDECWKGSSNKNAAKNAAKSMIWQETSPQSCLLSESDVVTPTESLKQPLHQHVWCLQDLVICIAVLMIQVNRYGQFFWSSLTFIYHTQQVWASE